MNFREYLQKQLKFSETLASIQLDVVCEVKNWAHGLIKSKSTSILTV